MVYENVEGGNIPIKAWTLGVPFEHGAKVQLRYTSMVPVVGPYIAVMPDVHSGIGATVGSVVPTREAIIPAAVGVDIGCGMMAVKTSLHANQLPDNLKALRSAIEQAVPHGRTNNGSRGDRGAWHVPHSPAVKAWSELEAGYKKVLDKH